MAPSADKQCIMNTPRQDDERKLTSSFAHGVPPNRREAQQALPDCGSPHPRALPRPHPTGPLRKGGAKRPSIRTAAVYGETPPRGGRRKRRSTILPVAQHDLGANRPAQTHRSPPPARRRLAALIAAPTPTPLREFRLALQSNTAQRGGLPIMPTSHIEVVAASVPAKEAN